MKVKLKKEERGWGGHFICADACSFRRNTLLTYGSIRIVVSTVGLMKSFTGDSKYAEIGCNRYYETMAFHSDVNDEEYHDADVSREVTFDSMWSIDELCVDNKANDMHETVVREISGKLKKRRIR